MEESRMQILIAVTLLLIGIFFIVSEVLALLGAGRNTIGVVSMALSVIIFVLATATSIILISDAMKMPEKD